MSTDTRYRVMSSIRKHDTKPEIALRRALWSAGVRGRRCHARLLGSPDVACIGRQVAVFVDGVWWHGHPDDLPRSRRGPYWDAKIAGNMARDRRVTRVLRACGWRVARVWDLDVLKSLEKAARRVLRALQGRPGPSP